MLHQRSSLLRFALLLLCTTATSTVGAQTLPTGQRIKDLAGSVWFGLRTDSRARTLDRTIFLRECNAGQFTHYPAWGGWPERGSYDLPTLGANNDYFHNAGLPSVMHMFVGPDQYLPTWLKEGTWDQDVLDQLLKELIGDTISASVAKEVDVWNIVNEAVDWGGAGWAGTKFLELGYEPDASGLTGDAKVFDEVPVYIRKAFEYARQHSAAELELRDYDNDGLENQFNNSAVKTKGFYQLVRHLLALNTPLNAVGFQGHFNISNPMTWSNLTENVRRYRALGLKVYVSEMDAQLNDNATTWDEDIAQLQGEYYYNYVKAALAGGVHGIFIWGVRDNQDRGWRRGENAVLFDAAGEPKPAYYGVQRAFAEYAGSAGSPSAIGGAGGATSVGTAAAVNAGGNSASAGGWTATGSAVDDNHPRGELERPGSGGSAGHWGGDALSGFGGSGSESLATDGIPIDGGAVDQVEGSGGSASEDGRPGTEPKAGGGADDGDGSSLSGTRPSPHANPTHGIGGSGCDCGAVVARNSWPGLGLLALCALGLCRRTRRAQVIPAIGSEDEWHECISE